MMSILTGQPLCSQWTENEGGGPCTRVAIIEENGLQNFRTLKFCVAKPLSIGNTTIL